MKNKEKVVHLRPEQEEIEGVIIPGTIALLSVGYDMDDDDNDGDLVAQFPTCEVDVEIVGKNENGDLGLDWDFRFEQPGLFTINASYQTMVEITGQGTIDPDELAKEVSFPVLGEFALLIAFLSKASIDSPYVLGPVELSGLIWGLDDLDFDFEDDELF